jgi:hypothetical protein
VALSADVDFSAVMIFALEQRMTRQTAGGLATGSCA